LLAPQPGRIVGAAVAVCILAWIILPESQTKIDAGLGTPQVEAVSARQDGAQLRQAVFDLDETGNASEVETDKPATENECMEFLENDQVVDYLTCTQIHSVATDAALHQILVRLLEFDRDPYAELEAVRATLSYSEALRLIDMIYQHKTAGSDLRLLTWIYLRTNPPESVEEWNALQARMDAHLNTEGGEISMLHLVETMGSADHEFRELVAQQLETLLIHSFSAQSSNAKTASISATFDLFQDDAVASDWLLDRFTNLNANDLTTLLSRALTQKTEDSPELRQSLQEWARRYPTELAWIQERSTTFWREGSFEANFVNQL